MSINCPLFTAPIEVDLFSYSLKPLDIEIMKRLGTRVNLIPVIAKADTLTQNDLITFKQRVRHIGRRLVHSSSEFFPDP